MQRSRYRRSMADLWLSAMWPLGANWSVSPSVEIFFRCAYVQFRQGGTVVVATVSGVELFEP